MYISSNDLNTLMYWAKVGVSNHTDRAKKYREKYPDREDPYEKIHRINTKVHHTKHVGK